MTPLINILRNGGAASIEAVVRRDLEALTVLPAQRLTMPQTLKDVIREVTQRDYVADSLTLGLGAPSGSYNKRQGATTRFILSHGPQSLGRKYRMGAMLHEMTHLSNADSYGNTVFMFAIPAGSTDAEMLSRSRTRRGKLEGLIAGFGSDYAIEEELRKELVAKYKYPISGKFGANYVGKMDDLKLLSAAEKAHYMKLATDGMDAELIEYDSVINQTALWCELSGVSQSNANFANLLNLVAEAHALRTSRS